MKLRVLWATLAVVVVLAEPARADAPVTFPLYSKPKPHAEDMRERADVNLLGDGQAVIRNVVNPSLTLYLPESGKSRGGASVIVAPGGGFMMLSWESEGTMVGSDKT